MDAPPLALGLLLLLFLFPAEPLAPAGDVARLAALDREGSLRHVFRHRRAGRNRRIPSDAHRRDQVRVAADRGALADRRLALHAPVVVHRDRAAAEARPGTDDRVAEGGEVVGLHAGAEGAVLELDEVADPHALGEPIARPQVRRGAELAVVADLARLDHAVRLQVDALAEARPALERAAGLDHAVAADLD